MIRVTVIQADNFHTLRNNKTWTTSLTPDRLAALYRASDYIQAVYLVDGHEDSSFVQMAVMMLAVEMLTKPLSVAAPAQAILSEATEAGDGAFADKTTYAAPSNDPYPLITAILSPIPRRVDAAIREASKTPSPTLTSIRLRRA
ncbi:hypothetical protein QP179_10000 [Sphingomonas aurantiaca]|uniref:hypothetical protein n=1 Tax=Sphingomonas aurantiaca TaxID=185949 RepID=UPI002FE0163B